MSNLNKSSPPNHDSKPVEEQGQYGEFITTPNRKPAEQGFDFKDNNQPKINKDQSNKQLETFTNQYAQKKEDIEKNGKKAFGTFGDNQNPDVKNYTDTENVDLVNKQKNGDTEARNRPNVNGGGNVLGFSTDVRELGTEEIIDIENKEETKKNTPINRVLYIFFQYYWKLCIWILFSIMIIMYYKGDTNNFKNLALALAIANGVKIVINFILFLITRKQDPDMNKVYFWNGFSSLSFLILFLGGYLFFNGNVDKLYYFAIHHIVVHFIILIGANEAAKIYADDQFYYFAESIQILFICIKLGSPGSLSGWNTTTIFYFIAYILGLVVGGFAGIMAFVMLFIGLFRRAITREMRIMFFVFFIILATICWVSVLLFVIFLGFRRLLNAGVVTPLEISFLNLDTLLYNASIALLALSSFYLIFISIISFLLRDSVRKNLSNDQIQRLGMVSFAKEMQLGIKKTSDTYYQPDNLEKKAVDEPVNLEENKQECILCYSNPNDVIIKPCGHSGYCKSCMMNYLKTKKICPMCKLGIDTLLIFYYDEERRGYFSKEAIRVANVDK